VLDQHAELNFYGASSLKQQSTEKTCQSSQRHIILTLIQSVFPLKKKDYKIGNCSLGVKQQSLAHYTATKHLNE